MVLGVKVEGQHYMRRRHVSLGGPAPEFIISFRAEERARAGDVDFLTNPMLNDLIQHRNLKGRFVEGNNG